MATSSLDGAQLDRIHVEENVLLLVKDNSAPAPPHYQRVK